MPRRRGGCEPQPSARRGAPWTHFRRGLLASRRHGMILSLTSCGVWE
jgi:hypothetical protein